MVYSDFTMRELSSKFGIKEQKQLLFDIDKISPLLPSSLLQSELADAKLLPDSSEKAKSEAFIFPILKEIWREADRKFYFYSGYSFNVSEADKLTGVCDYLLFLKLDHQQATIDTERYATNAINLPILLGVLKHIIGLYV